MQIRIKILGLFVALAVILAPKAGLAMDELNEFVVYGTFKGLDMGDPKNPPTRDYYVNMGTTHGVSKGTTLEVMRKMPTFDLLRKKLLSDVTFPIARIKIIHAESGAAIGRLEKMLPAEETPTILPVAVMVGDLVRIAN